VKPEEAFDRYHQAIFSFAYRVTRRADLAEDITQECFLALLRGPGRFDEARGSLKTYLYGIARNLVLKNFRDTRESQADTGGLLLAGDPRSSLDVGLAVERAVAELPHLQQEALVLFEYEGVTLEEIADIVGAEVGTVKGRLHRARESLRRQLAPLRQGKDIHGTARE
jgi:RNA polymerase sigma-70 factor (ECF subfamily)